MSKALTKAQADLDKLKAELEAWIAAQPPVSAPTARRTRTQLITAATAPVVVPVAVAAPVAVLAPPVVFVDATHITAALLATPAPAPAPAVVAAPAPVKVRITMRQAFLEGYRSV